MKYISLWANSGNYAPNSFGGYFLMGISKSIVGQKLKGIPLPISEAFLFVASSSRLLCLQILATLTSPNSQRTEVTELFRSLPSVAWELGVVSWGTTFPFSLPCVACCQMSENHHFLCFTWFSIVQERKVNIVPVILSWLEIEVP